MFGMTKKGVRITEREVGMTVLLCQSELKEESPPFSGGDSLFAACNNRKKANNGK
ncbi:hypothetical protein THEYE_A1670 [Thermodesulfovibrio yellowstonii DSM 11347]|uniref:Uncharacterized protein n=1 Tax=Thermodesulfovibrio yellowstonii (strain ATCC 51303 / DSM 11347 / YP87) TaxID=289376 RepID=B5YGR3_THEYD|nr:hypothetical protein THEYE_A1670 [Thermodesulfovibrio yellowstonii DSM 11347]